VCAENSSISDYLLFVSVNSDLRKFILKTEVQKFSKNGEAASKTQAPEG
jgi:hypothetical protein